MENFYFYAKLTCQLLLKTRLSKSGQPYKTQVVDPRQQQPQGQSFANTGTHQQNRLFDNVNST